MINDNCFVCFCVRVSLHGYKMPDIVFLVEFPEFVASDYFNRRKCWTFVPGSVDLLPGLEVHNVLVSVFNAHGDVWSDFEVLVAVQKQNQTRNSELAASWNVVWKSFNFISDEESRVNLANQDRAEVNRLANFFSWPNGFPWRHLDALDAEQNWVTAHQKDVLNRVRCRRILNLDLTGVSFRVNDVLEFIFHLHFNFQIGRLWQNPILKDFFFENQLLRDFV